MKKQNKTDKQRKNEKRLLLFEIALGILTAAAIFLVFLSQNNSLAGNRTAISIDGKNYKLCEFNYYYDSYYNTFRDENSEYLAYMFDTGKSLKTQAYDETQSWFDYFVNQSADSMTGVIAVADKAKQAGYTLSEESRKSIDNALQNVEQSASNRDMTASRYLSNIYGAGMTENRFREHLTNVALAKEYSETIRDSFAFSDEELRNQYETHIEKYTFVNYERFYVKTGNLDKNSTQTEKKAAKKIADEICGKVKNGATMQELGKEYQSHGTYYALNNAYYDKTFNYGDWLFSTDRKDGDCTVIDDGAGYYVLQYHSSDRGEYQTANVIDLCFPVDTGSVKAEDAREQISQLYEDSCEKAEKILNVWESGEKTQERFESLISQYDEESDSDGSFENLTKNKLDSKLDEWIFDSQRKPGDCSVLYTDSGFHVLYFAGNGEEAWRAQAESDLRENTYEDWYQTTMADAKTKRHNSVLQMAGGEA